MNIIKSIGVTLGVCFVALAHLQAQTNLTQQILQMKTFREYPILIGTNQPTDSENKELLEVLANLQGSSRGSGLERFLNDYPHSPWAASLHYDYACYCRRTGRTTKALEHFQAAWNLTKNDPTYEGVCLGGSVLGNWMDLLSSLGRLDQMKELMAESDQWHFVNPHDRDLFLGAKNSYYLMQNHPGIAYRCGTFALKAVGETLQPTNRALEGLTGIPSPTNGFSMAALEDLAMQYHLHLVAVRRTTGQGLVVPSIVHWRQNHYAAILDKDGDNYLVSDPTFGNQMWMSADVINEEASGEFLIPATSQTDGWTKLVRNETEKIHGMGLPNNINDGRDCFCVYTFGGEILCFCPGKTKGMPVWSVSEPYINLWLQDNPLSYLTSRGESFDFQITYKQRDTRPSDAALSSAGWNNSWNSFARMTSTLTGNGVSYQRCTIAVFLPNGGEVDFAPGLTGAPAYDSESRLMIMPVEGLGTFNGGGDAYNNGLRLVHADGSQDIYGYVQSNPNGGPAYDDCLLTRHIDPHGTTTWFNYGSITGHGLVVSSVVDCDGRTNTLSYTSKALLSSVTNAYGLSAHFLYDTNENLTNMVDAQGLSSSITYDTNGFPTSLKTPYGTTHFSIGNDGLTYGGGLVGNAGGDNNGLIDRSALVVDPTGATNLYMYRYDAQQVISSTNYSSGVPTNTPFGTLDTGAGSNAGTNSAVYFRNSFYWGPMQLAHLSTQAMTNFTSNDYLLGRMQHWLQDSNQLFVTDDLSVKQDPSPDGVNPGLRTFYDYQGKTSNDQVGTNSLPSVRTWRLPDGSTHYDYLLFDYFGNITNWISTYTLPNGGVGTRTNQFIYASNTYTNAFGQTDGNGNITTSPLTTFTYTLPDLLTEVIGADGNPIWSYGNFDIVSRTNYFFVTGIQTNGTIQTSLRVLPDYATNGLGQIVATTFAPNGNDVTNFLGGPVCSAFSGMDKISSVTSVAGLTTTNIYNSSGFLAQTIDEQIGRTNSFSYGANGMTTAWTNELGLNLGITWDNLLRLTNVAFTDGTYDFVYYNPTQTPLDPQVLYDRMGNPTTYGYDGDRHLTSITRANSATTLFDWCGCGALTATIDALTNLTSLNYDNQGNITNVAYADGSSLTYHYDSCERMTSVSDALGRSLLLGHNNQGLVTTVSNAYGLVESVTYDIMDRPANVTDANGVTVTNTYDVVNELLRRTWPGGVSESYGYNAAGLIAYTNRDKQVTQYGRDTAGRLIAVTNANLEVVQLAYNPSSEIIRLIDGLNHTNAWQYNPFGWLTNKVDGLGRNVFQFAYNSDGWLTNRLTLEKGNTAYLYDSVGNLTNIVYPNSTIKYAYDPLNELTNMVDAVGTNSFSYTAIGELQSETGPWSTDTVTYTYSQTLRTNLTLSEPGGSWSQGYGYDSAWRLISLTSPAGTFGYNYNFKPASALVTSIGLPNGASITNIYDSLARLTQTSLNNHWGHVLDGYTYTPDPLGLRTNTVRNLGLTSSSVSVGYDNIGQLISWVAKETNGSIRLNEQLSFGFDGADNLHFRTNGLFAQTFTIDPENELTNVSRNATFTVSGAMPAPATNITVNGQVAQSYGDFTFAATNNSLINGTNTFTIIATNIYGLARTNTLAVNLPQSVNLAFDRNGNMTNDGTRTFSYNTENQLTNVLVTNQWRSDFVYDGLGRRRIVRGFAWQSGAWVETNEVRIVYDGYLPIQERDTNNTVLMTYTRGIDLSAYLSDAGGIGGLLARTDTNGSTFYHADGSGNITALMDGNEVIVARYIYGPFGKLIGQSGSMADVNEMEFSSMPHDNLSGLSFYPFRAYEPNFQRWLNEDPIQESGGINLYQFVANGPVNRIDLNGLGEIDLGPGSANPDNIQNLVDITREAEGVPRSPLSEDQLKIARDAFNNLKNGAKDLCEQALKKLDKNTLKTLEQDSRNGMRKALDGLNKAATDADKQRWLRQALNQEDRLNAVQRVLRSQ